MVRKHHDAHHAAVLHVTKDSGLLGPSGRPGAASRSTAAQLHQGAVLILIRRPVLLGQVQIEAGVCEEVH